MGAGDFTATLTVTGQTTSGKTAAGLSVTKTYTSIADVVEQSITVPITTPLTILTKGSAVAGATLSTINFFAIKNLDTTNSIHVGILTASDTVYHIVGPGEFQVLVDQTIDTNTAASTESTFIAVASINAMAISQAVKCEYIAF